VLRYLDLIGRYFIQYSKVRLSYRADFLISLFTTTLASVFGLAVVFLVFHRIPQVKGWTYWEILFLFGFSLLPLALFNLLSINLYYFAETYIIGGKFDRVLLRPVPSIFQIVFEQFRLEAMGDFFLGLAVLAYAARHMDRAFAIWDILFGAFAAIAGAALYLAVFLILTSVSFWFEDRAGIIPPIYNLLSFGRYPLDIYSDLIKFFLSWIIPFGFAAFYPGAVLLGRPHYQLEAALLPVLTVAFATLAVFVWNRGVNHYGSTGS
jgi:ABC-2 type transport system permease protein